MSEALQFTCPRCDRPATEPYYGPCRACREELVTAASGLERSIETKAYEPTMNVVPNQVATKD